MIAPDDAKAVRFTATQWASENDGGWGVSRSERHFTADGKPYRVGSVVERCTTREAAELLAARWNAEREPAQASPTREQVEALQKPVPSRMFYPDEALSADSYNAAIAAVLALYAPDATARRVDEA